MQAIICAEAGPPERLRLGEVPDPLPGPGQALLEVKAAGVNFADTLIIQGLYQEKPDYPFVPGMELAGVVAAVGEGVAGLAPGDRVAAATTTGAFAERAAVEAAHCVKLPEAVSDAQAAALLVSYGTGVHALRQRADLQPGETLLVLGAAGGVGIAAIQIGKAMGARVIAGASSAEKLALARANGADAAVDYSKEELRGAVKSLTGSRGADVIFDPVGGDLFDQATRCIAFDGRLLIIGFASGRIPKLAANLALVKGFSAVGVYWGRFAKQEQPQRHAENMALLFAWLEEGRIRPHIDAELPLAQAPVALTKMIRREVRGKLVLRPP